MYYNFANPRQEGAVYRMFISGTEQKNAAMDFRMCITGHPDVRPHRS